MKVVDTVASDSRGDRNDGNLVNGTAWVEGKFGKALSFDGLDDYVIVPNFLFSNDCTISFWAYSRLQGNVDTVNKNNIWMRDNHYY
jgi:hypothetical protein